MQLIPVPLFYLCLKHAMHLYKSKTRWLIVPYLLSEIYGWVSCYSICGVHINLATLLIYHYGACVTCVSPPMPPWHCSDQYPPWSAVTGAAAEQVTTLCAHHWTTGSPTHLATPGYLLDTCLGWDTQWRLVDGSLFWIATTKCEQWQR